MKHITYTGIVLLIISSNVQCARIAQAEKNKRTAAFMEALVHNELNRAKMLLAQGINLEFQTRDGLMPLTLAALNKYKEIIELLINAGADINKHDRSGLTALDITAETGDKEIAELLIKAGAQVDQESFGQTPLYWAAHKGNKDVIEVLINAHANVNFVDKDGESVLYQAAFKGFNDIMKLLIKAGADVKIVAKRFEKMRAKKRLENLLQVAAEVNSQADIYMISRLTQELFGLNSKWV